MKKIMKQLLGMMLVIAMVVGLVPVNSLFKVNAAESLNSNYLYLDTSNMGDNWKNASELYLFSTKWANGGTSVSNGKVTINGTSLFYWDISNYDNKTGEYGFLSVSSWSDVSGGNRTHTAVDTNGNAVDLSSAGGKVYRATGEKEHIDGTESYKIKDVTSEFTSSGGDSGDSGDSDDTDSTVETRRIYFDTTRYIGTTGSAGWGSAYAYIWNNVDGSGKNVTLNKVEGKSGVFYYDVPVTCTNIIFKPNSDNWSGQTSSQTIPSDKNLFTATSFGTTTGGIWGTYTTADTDNNFPSNVTGKVTFFDLYTDTEIMGKDAAVSGYGLTGWKVNGQDVSSLHSMTAISRGFSLKVNKAIASYWNGTGTYPLYFGNFQPYYFLEKNTSISEGDSLGSQDPWWWNNNEFKDGNNKYNRSAYMNMSNYGYYNFSWFLNRSIDVDVEGKSSALYGAVVQGLVGDKLVNGNIVANGTTTVLPQFNKAFYESNSSIGKVYDTMEFPFVVREIKNENDVAANYYQFDSGVGSSDNRDVVRMNDEGTGLIYYDGTKDNSQIVNGVKSDGTKTPGFFPFNDPEDTPVGDNYGAIDNDLNYGFGMKLEIEFTIDEDGKVLASDGKTRIPAIFSFSGDDDVWIYVDGNLALDLGGSHGVAEGKLDFSTGSDSGTATVQYVKTVSGQSTASGAIDVEIGRNGYEGYGNKDYINSMEAGAGVIENKTSPFAIDKSDPAAIHTLTIFYEERGMFESNFKSTFNLEQPTVLKTTNTVNVNNVNSALQSVTEAAAAKDTFTYEINDKDSQDVTGKSYTTADGTKNTFNGTMALKDGESATFTKQFDRATELELIQVANTKYDTSWTLSELSDTGLGSTIAASYQTGKDNLKVSDGRITGETTTAFKLENADNGENQEVPAKVQADYVQTPKTGSIAIQKKMDDGTTTDALFEFKVTLSNVFGGGSSEAAYDLTYDVYDSTTYKIVRKNATATNGIVQIQAGQFALIKGIPVGTTYKVVEQEKSGYSLDKLDATTNISNDEVTGTKSTATVTGTVVADTSENVDMFVYTNAVVTLNDSFLVEIGKENTLNVIPDPTNEGSLTEGSDLAKIANAWNGASEKVKGLVFIVKGQPYVNTDETSADYNKPIKELTVDGVTYTIAEDGEGNPVLKVTPNADTVIDTNVISVKYQLVELTSNGTVKYNTTDLGDGETVQELASITGVITMKNYLYKANDDIYVLDYGLDVDLAENTGSGLFENDSLANPELTGTTSIYWKTATGSCDKATTASTTEVQSTTNVKGTYGTIKPESDQTNGFAINVKSKINPTITYSLDKFLEGKDYFNYGVMIKKSTQVNDSQTSNRFRLNVKSDICIMPAEVVYYEDDFNSDSESTDSSSKIIYSGTYETEGETSDITQSNDQSEQYGHDDAYASGTGDSAGSSTKLTAKEYDTKATFTFTGTGFDIIARTNDETAGIYCIVQKVNDDGTLTLVKSIGVDTYYANGDLYQIPVIHADVDYGKYKVTLGIKAGNNGNTVVYLDGIRIYNTLGTSGDEAYIDNEEGVTFVKVGDLILGSGEITETGVVGEDGNEITGQVIDGSKAALLYNTYSTPGEDDDEETFVSTVIGFEALGYTKTEDTNGGAGESNRTTSLLQYMHSGPNNEIYLDNTASIAFIVKPESGKTPTIQIEAKLVNIDGTDGAPGSNGVDLNVWNGSSLVKVDSIATATAMYYPIDLAKCQKFDDGSYLVVISGNYDDVSSCISFSNLKYKNCTLANPLDEEYSKMIADTIDTSLLSGSEEAEFISFTGATKVVKNTWYTNKHSVELSKDVFGDDDPEFAMYYVNNGVKKKISVTVMSETAVKDEESGETLYYSYKLKFKAPNATGTFPIEIHYVTDNGESAEYIATSMKVSSR